LVSVGSNTKKHFPAPCSQQDLSGLNQINDCSDHNCHSKADYIELLACMEDHCRATQNKKSIRDVFASLSDSCVGCIFSGTKRNVFDCLNEKYAFKLKTNFSKRSFQIWLTDDERQVEKRLMIY
jgi:hypothetical protein